MAFYILFGWRALFLPRSKPPAAKTSTVIGKFSKKFLIIKTTKLLSIEWPNLFVADPLWGGGGREGGG